MNRQRRPTWTEVRALLCRPPRDFLIVRRHDATDAPWEFPGIRLAPRTAPEDALRRHCQDALGVIVSDAVPLPPFEYNHGTHSITYLCYYCPAARDEALPLAYATARWVQQDVLPAYLTDSVTQAILQRLPPCHPGPEIGRNRSRT